MVLTITAARNPSIPSTRITEVAIMALPIQLMQPIVNKYLPGRPSETDVFRWLPYTSQSTFAKKNAIAIPHRKANTSISPVTVTISAAFQTEIYNYYS